MSRGEMISKHFAYEKPIDFTINLLSGEKHPVKGVSKIAVHLQMNGEFCIEFSHQKDGCTMDFIGFISEEEFLRIKKLSELTREEREK